MLNNTFPSDAEAAPSKGPSKEQRNTSPPVFKAAPVEDQPNSIRSAPAENRRLFGLRAKGYHTGQQDSSDDYKERYPEDPMFEETGPNARVWRTYLVESTAFDENMVGEARDGLDAMLIFAGLFSAVVTSFLVQTSENLEPDYTQLSASLLSELIAVQRAAANRTSVNTVPAAALNLNTKFTPDTLDVWVNGLWVISLTLSLMVALAAVLIKQWLHRYVAFHSGTPKERSHIRHSKFIGFKKWQVLSIIGSLPVIMHLSLALFLLGLFIFLIPLQLILSCIIGALAFITYALYSISNILPVFIPHCPYQTPLSDFIVALWRSSRTRRLQVPLQIPEPVARDIVGDVNESLSVQALHWLFNVSTNPSVHSVVLQAIGGLPATAALEVRKLFNHEDTSSILRLLMDSCIDTTEDWSEHRVKPDLEATAERLMRTSLMCHFEDHSDLSMAATRTWQDLDSNCKGDLRYLATALALTQDSRPFDNPFANAGVHHLLPKYILSHHKQPHHPLIWKTLVEKSMSQGVFTDYTTDPVLFWILYPAVYNSTSFMDRPNKLQTMIPAICLDQDLHRKFCEHLLAKVLTKNVALEAHLSVSAGNTTERLLMTTLEFALHCVSIESSSPKSVHWQLIIGVLNHGVSPDETLNGLIMQPHMIMFLKKFLAALIKQTDICCFHAQESEALFMLRQDILRFYLLFTWGQIDYGIAAFQSVEYRWFSSDHMKWNQVLLLPQTQDHEITFLHAIKQPLSDIPLVEQHMLEHVNVLFSILASGIRDGLSSAYTLVVAYDCLDLALKCPYHDEPYAKEPALELASTFAMSLSSNTTLDAATREHSVNYLFKTQNLHLVTISYLGVLEKYNPWDPLSKQNIRDRVYELVGLHPDERTWEECRCWLRHISKWTKDRREEEYLRDKHNLEDTSGLERLFKTGPKDVEQLIHLIEEFFTNGETTTNQALGRPRTMRPNPGPSLPALEVDVEERNRWMWPRLPKFSVVRKR